MTTTAEEPTPASVLKSHGPKGIIALLLWKDRHRNPSLSVTINQADVTGLQQCLDYLQVEPSVEAWVKPGGMIVALVQKGTTKKDPDGNVTSLGDAIVPIENNQGDKDKADAMAQVNAIRAGANALAGRLLAEDAAGIAARSTIEEAAQALRVLAQG